MSENVRVNELDVVVLNWRDEEMTRRCVNSLPADEGIRHVYVVDNESDGQLALPLSTARANITVLPVRENRGFAGGIDVAFAHRARNGVDGPVLVLNNDVEMTPGSVSALLDHHRRHPRSVIGPRLENPDGSLQAAGHHISRATGIARPTLTEDGRVDYVTWACILVPDKIYAELSGLSLSYFMYWEDADFGVRASRAGIENRIASNAVAIHALSASGRKVGTKLAEYYARSLRVFGDRHRGLPRLRTRVGILMLVGKRIALRDFRGARAQIRGWREQWPETAYERLVATKQTP